MRKIVVIGSVNIDIVFHVPYFVKPKETISSESMERFLGGKGLNQAIALSKAYPEVKLFANISSKDTSLKEEINAFGVDPSMIESLDGEAGTAFIQVDPSGENCIILNKGVNHKFTKERINSVISSLHEGDLIVLQNEINELETIIKSAKLKGLKIAFNPSPFESKILDLPLQEVDYLIFNEVEGRMLSHFSEPDKILKTLHNRYPNTVLVLTLGSIGVMAQQANMTYEMSGLKVEAVDTTAAGDAFTGYFLAGVQKGLSVAEALEMANVAGALTVTKRGASSSIPTLQEVLDAISALKPTAQKITQNSKM
jgi:ribokinase